MRSCLAILVFLLATGCDDRCQTLQEVCDTCTDPNFIANCESTVELDVQDLCSDRLDSFRDVCVSGGGGAGGTTTTSSTSSTSTTSATGTGGSTTSAAGGSGGSGGA